MEKNFESITKKELEIMLSEQTNVILNAVDGKLRNMEARFNQKLDSLMTTLDNFLKRLTDFEEEFTIMKADIDRVKTVIKEKLGVEL